MRKKTCIAVPAITAALIMLLLWSKETAAQQLYNIRGIVTDKVSNEPLVGASVYDSVHQIGTFTKDNGRFLLHGVPEGEASLIITYLGYNKRIETITVRKDEELQIGLSSGATSLKQITVISSFSDQQRALNQQRAADNIKNIISADQIGKFPDLNVAEALQRVPGINISRSKGEGSTVSIRGTPVHFTSISINGVQLPSTQEDGSRSEALDLIPADLLGSMVVTKALTADMDGDAIGGNIDLKTPTAQALKAKVRAQAEAGFNDLSGGLNGSGRLKAGKRFFKSESNERGRLGILLNGSYYKTDNALDRIDASWSGLPKPIKGLDTSGIVPLDYQYRKRMNERTRMGAAATIDYQVENHEIIFHYMYNHRQDNDVRNRLRFDFDQPNAAWITMDSLESGRERKDIDIWNEKKINHDFNLQGTHHLGDWTAEWLAAYSISRRRLTSTRGDFARDGIAIVADNPDGMMAEIPEYRPVAPGYDPKNPLLLDDFRRYEDDASNTDASNKVAKLDITKRYTLAGHNGYVKFGGKLRKQTNDKLRDDNVLSFYDPNGVLNLKEAFARVSGRTEPVSYLRGRYELGPRVDKQKFMDYLYKNRRLLVEGADAWDAERISKEDTYEASEDIYAGYLMTHLQIRRLLFVAGARYEYDRVNYEAFDVQRSGTDVIASPVNGGNDYGFLLPDLHLRYSINELANIRFAYTQSYARPNFVDIVPYVNYDADAVTLYLGNTDLEPSLSNNLDLMFEKYDADAGIFSVGLFFKTMSRFQFTRVIPSLAEDYPGYPNTAGFKFRQEQNGDRAAVYGVELNFIHQYKNLPGLLKGLSTYLNYTFTQSDASTQDRKGIRLPGQAMHTGNASLSFDYKGFTSKFSLNYNGSFIESVASNANDDIIQDARFQLDANISQRLNRHFNLYADFVNITNSPARQYQGGKAHISRLEYFGWSTRLGITFRL